MEDSFPDDGDHIASANLHRITGTNEPRSEVWRDIVRVAEYHYVVNNLLMTSDQGEGCT